MQNKPPLLKHGKEWKTNVNSELKSILSVIQVELKNLDGNK